MNENIKLYHGDCLEVMKTFDANIIDLTVTSPPYDNLRNYEGSLNDWTFEKFQEIAKELFRITKKGGVVVWVVGDATIKGSETGTSFKQALYFKEIGFNLHDTMIWEKSSFNHDPRNMRYKQFFEYMFIMSKGKPKTYNEIKDVPIKSAGLIIKSTKTQKKGEKRDYGYIKMGEWQARCNIWKISSVARSQHPAPFPEKLANDHIISWSNPGDTVFDPFMGSGTTGVACVNTNRKFIGIERVENYFDIAKKRIEEANNTLF